MICLFLRNLFQALNLSKERQIKNCKINRWWKKCTFFKYCIIIEGIFSSGFIFAVSETPEANTGFSVPMENDYYGTEWLENSNGVPHPGTDYNDSADDVNLEIKAVANGKIVNIIESNNGLGNSVVIEHNYRGEKIYSLYGHLSTIDVKKDDIVQKGDAIGKQGHSGYVIGNPGTHLHWEIRKGSHPNPKNPHYWPSFNTTTTWENKVTKIEEMYYDPELFVSTHGPYVFPETLPDNSLSRTGQQIYFIKNGKRHHILSPTLLQKLHEVYNFTGKDFRYEDADLTKYSEASQITGDGLIIKSPDSPGIYLVQNSKKRVFSEKGYLEREYKFDADPDSPTYILLPDDVVRNIPEEDNPIFQDTKNIDLQLIFKKDGVKTSNFVVGETKESAIIVRGDGYTVNTYLKVTDPNGVVNYAYFPKVQNQTADDPLEFGHDKRSLTDVLWNVRYFEWTFNRYTLPQNDRIGTWTWEFFYEDVNRAGADPPLASASATYTVYPSSIFRIAGTLIEPPDTDPPFVLSKTPSAGATTVPINTTVNITFSEPMNQSATEGAFSLLMDRSIVTLGTFSWEGNSLTFLPNLPLNYAKAYTVIIRADAADENGNTMDLFEWSFATEPLPPPPPLNPPTISIPSFSDQQRIWVMPSPYSPNIEIGAGILSDRGGGIILVQPGEYDEWLNIFSNVLYKSTDGPSSTIIKRELTTRDRTVTNATVEGFTINAENSSSQVYSTANIGNNSSEILLKDNIIVPIPSNQAIYVFGGSSALFIGNTISSHNDLAVYIADNSTTIWGRNKFEDINTCLEIRDSDIRFFANIFYNNTNVIEFGGSSNNTIIAQNNIFVGNIKGIWIAQPPQKLYAKNNVFYNDETAISAGGTSLLTILNNVFQVTATPIWAPDTQTIDIQFNNFVGTGIGSFLSGVQPASNNYVGTSGIPFPPEIQPNFIDPIGLNFRLSSSSGLIDAGYPDTDYNDLMPPGQGGSRNDVGAYGGPGPYDIDNQPPTLNPIGDKSIVAGDELNFVISGSDPNGEVLLLSSRFLPANATFSGNTFNWTPQEDQFGDYEIPFAAYDGQLADYEFIKITVIPPPGSPDASLDASAYSFDPIEIQTSDSWQFSVTNQGNADLIIHKVELTASQGFSINQTTPLTINQEEQQVFDVTFSPITADSYRTTVILETNDPENPTFNIEIDGVGTAPVVPDIALLGESSFDFGKVLLGETKEVFFKIANNGQATLSVNISIDPPFSIVPNNLNIEPGIIDSFKVSFSPITIGTQLALLILSSNDPDQNTMELSVSGTGVLSIITAVIEIDDITATYATTISVPVRATNTTDQGIWAASIFITIAGNGRVAKVTGIETAGTMIEEWTTVHNIVAGADGIDTLMVSAATDSNPLTGNGTLFNMILEIQDVRHPDATQLEVVRVLFNDEDRTLESQGGSLTLVGTDGSVDISPANIEPGTNATIFVIDADENRDDGTSEQIRVQVVSTECEDSEWIILTETQSGTFAGDIQTVYNQTCTPENGRMELTAVDTMIVSYVDSLDAAGATATRKDTTAALKTGTDGVLRVSRVVQAKESSNGLRDTVRIELVDPDLNTDENAVEQVSVILENMVSGEIEHLALDEIEANTGIFRRRIPTGFVSSSTDDDGVITISAQDSMLVSYEDILNSEGPKRPVSEKGYAINLFGDLSGNGSVTAYDASLILRMRVGLIQPDKWDSLEADLDGMNQISTLDAVLVLRHDVRKIFRFPIQTGADFDGEAVSSNSSHPFFKPVAGQCAIGFGETIVQDDGIVLVPVEFSERRGIVAGSFDISVGPAIGIEAAFAAEGYENYLIEHNVVDGVLKLDFAGIEAAVEGQGPVVWIQMRSIGEDGAWMRFNRVLLNDQQVTIASGEVALTAAPVVPREFAVLQNYPNPFNHGTVVPYHVAGEARVVVAVFNLAGQQVRVLVDKTLSPGAYQAAWDGTDEAGRPVTSGVYLYRVCAGDFSATKKMILLK